MSKPKGKRTRTEDNNAKLRTNTSRYRTSVVFSPAVGENLDIYAFKTRRAKTDIIEEAVVNFLEKQGYKPHQMPKDVNLEFKY